MPNSTANPTANPNFNYFSPGQGGNPTGATAPAGTPSASSTINSQSIAPSTPVTVPNAPASTNGAAANASIPSPIPTSSSIINQDTAPTATDNQATSLYNQIASITGSQQSLPTLTANSENNSAAYQASLKTNNDLTTQLQGLADQSTALSNAAAPGGSIQNTEQNNAQGRGITAAGLAPVSAADLRNNQVQQAAIASQSLTVKSAYYFANNQMTLAKQAADQAAQVQFDASTQQINGLKAQLAAIQPTLTKEQSAQAAQLNADLTDRANQIAQQKTDYTNGIALINGATTANGQNPQAQLAIAQARAIDPTDPQYLQKVGALLTQYQSNPTAVAQAVANLQNTKADIAYKNAQITALQQAGSGGALAANNTKTTANGAQYIDGSTLTGKDATAAQNAAAQAGIPYVDKANADLLNNIDIARSNLAGITQALSGLSTNSGLGNLLEKLNYAGEQITGSGNEAANLSSYNTWKEGMVAVFKGMAGAGTGSRGATLVTQLMNLIPAPSATKADAAAALTTMNSLLDNAQNGVLNNAPTQEPGSTVKGTVWNRPDGKYVSDGTQWVKQ